MRGLVFGLKCGALLGICDPNGSLPRTLAQSLFEDYPPLLTRLPKSGMTVNGKIYEQATWVHRTKEKGSGLLPTPTAREWQDHARMSVLKRLDNKRSGAGLLGRRISNVLDVTLFGNPVVTLNPLFAVVIMGYPEEWLSSNIKQSEIVLSLRLQSCCLGE